MIATDARGNVLSPACAPSSGGVFEIGDTRVLCTATDREGRRAEGSFVVTVHRGGPPKRKDTASPTLSVPADFTRETGTDKGLNVTYLATATDNIDGLLTPTCRPVSGARFRLGRTRVTCSATDTGGRTTRAHFIVTVVRADTGAEADATPPQISVPANIRIPATGPTGRLVRYVTKAKDDRDGTLTSVCDPPSGNVFAIGSHTVRCTAINRVGLAASRSFVVDVVDGPPVLHLSKSIRVLATSARGADVMFTASATDAVTGC